MKYAFCPSPVGRLTCTAEDGALTSLLFEGASPVGSHAPDHPLLRTAVAQLEEYFAGQRRSFEELPLRPRGTPFQQEVWRALRAIPFGETVSYADIARSIGRPRAVRAVGAANGRNPLAIIVPCHRVIGSNGTLTGYAGGLELKRWLLEHEVGYTRNGGPGSTASRTP